MSQPDSSQTAKLPSKKSHPVWLRLLQTLSPHRFYMGLGLILLLAISYFYVKAIDTECMGFIHDDGVYAVVGKSLALGKGFKLLHVIGEPGQIKYPFIYPLILSVIWFFSPHYPENLPALHYATIAFTVAACALIFFWLKNSQKLPGWLALLITAIIPANYYFLYFFSSIMSEGPYLFFTMLTLCFFHQVAKKQHPLSLNSILILVGLCSLCFLTRVLGLSLMAAVGGWLLLDKQWKNTLIYGVGCLVTGIFPWMIWVKLNTPTMNTFNYPLVNAYSNYGLEFFHNVTTADYFHGLGVSLLTLILKLQEVMFPVVPNFFKIYPQFKNNPDLVQWFSLMAMLLAYLLFGYFLLQCISAISRSWQKGQFQSARFSVPGLYLFFYISMIALWNYDDQMARFLTPVLPLLWLYFFKPVAAFLPELGQKITAPRLKVTAATLFTVFICALALLNTSGSYRTIAVSRTQHWVEMGRYRWLWGDYKASFQWIRENLPKDAYLSVASDVVFYLYTDRPTFYTFYASLRRKNGQFTEDSIPLLMNSLDHYKVNYLVAEPHMQFRSLLYPVNRVAKQLLDKYPSRFQHIYASPKQAIHVYKILPLKSAP